jgi:hypothetical protein
MLRARSRTGDRMLTEFAAALVDGRRPLPKHPSAPERA